MPEKSVLVVDDDESLLQALSVRLRRAGYRVYAAVDALQAVMMAHRMTPDIILLDIRIPAGGGVSVMEKLSQSAKTRSIPVVVMSGMDDTDLQHRLEELGAAGYFQKPFDTSKLFKVMDDLVG